MQGSRYKALRRRFCETPAVPPCTCVSTRYPVPRTPILMDTQIYFVIVGTFVGFVALAFVLLFPVYRFLNREEKAEKAWTPEAIARRQARAASSGDGAPGTEPVPDEP